jgi:CRP/FNR family cyclic AMP-dependent transcriptional regulator
LGERITAPIDRAKETGGKTNSRLQFGGFPQKVSFWNDGAELPRQRGRIFARGCCRCSFLHPERHGLTVAATRRKKAIIAVLLRGSFFGEGCLGGQAVRMYTARSIEQSNVIRLEKESTVRILKRDPEFAALFNAYLLSRVIRVEEDLVDQFFNFSEKRLARVLLLFGQIIKESKPESPLKVSQATLAEMVGTTRARVNKFMNAFKKRGFVHYNGGLQINSALVSAFLQNRPMSVVRRA